MATELDVLIADEATSPLDVSVRAAIVELFREVQMRHGVAYVFISHDLGLVRTIANRVIVLDAGQIMEQGPTGRMYEPPFHPYTEALMSAIPVPASSAKRAPIPLRSPASQTTVDLKGCPFHPCCPRKIGAICEEQAPPWRAATDGHGIRCHIPLDELASSQQTVPSAEPAFEPS